MLVDELQAEQVLKCEETCNWARMGKPDFPEKMM